MSLRDPDTGKLIELGPVKDAACVECPWRIECWGRTDLPHADFYTRQRRAEIWDAHPDRPLGTGARFGTRTVCHMTAPPGIGGTNPGSTRTRPCASELALAHRQLLAFFDVGCDYLTYLDGAGGGTPPLSERAVITFIDELGTTVTDFKRRTREQVLALLHPLTTSPLIDVGWNEED